MKSYRLMAFLFTFVALAIPACKSLDNQGSPDDLEPGEPTPAPTSPPQPLSSDAGGDQRVRPGQAVLLDGRASRSESAGSDLTYQWTQKSGSPTVELDDAASATPSFTAPFVTEPTELVFELTVWGPEGTAIDEVIITISPRTWSITGGITDALTGQSVPHATVTLENEDEEIVVHADAAGTYIAQVPADWNKAFIALAQAAGYALAGERIVPDQVVGDTLDVDFALERPVNRVSTFDDGDEGWLVVGNNLTKPTWAASGGRPGGYVAMQDKQADATWYWDAPATFTGDMSAAYGRTLSFDLSQSHPNRQFEGTDVVLRGAGLELRYSLPHLPHNGGTSYSVRLTERIYAWRNGATGELATRLEMRLVLADLTQLLIRGEYRDYADEWGALDNVMLDLGEAPLVPRTQTVVSRFDQNAEGWTAIGNGHLGASLPIWLPNDGRPAGHLELIDQSGDWTWYWDAPAAYLGDMSLAYGRNLRFDLFQSDTNRQFDEADVILRGDGLTLVFDTPYNPDTGWTSYVVPLDAVSGWWNLHTGQPATESDLRTVLARLSQLLIRGEFRDYNNEVGGLDNVVLELPN